MHKISILLTILCLNFLIAQTGQKDIPSSQDHPMISKYKDSVIVGYAFQEYGELTLPLGKAVLDKNVAYLHSQKEEGKLTRLLYLIPPKRSTLEVYKNYAMELEKAGFEILFSCAGDDECGTLFHQAIWSSQRALKNSRDLSTIFAIPSEQRLLVAKLTRPKGDVFVSLYIASNDQSEPKWASKRVTALLEVLETTPMQEAMVNVNAETMSKEINTAGHIALYGIYFDVDKTDIKPRSKPVLDEITKLLNSDPSLSLYIVGHTDNTGSLPYNMNLSKKRAKSVVSFLVSNYKVSAKRLEGFGVGPLAPVATNDTAEGKAKNRRVELIKK